MKKLMIGVGALVVLVAIGLIFLASNMDSVIATVIEDAGSKVTQVSVSLDSVKTSLSDKTAALNGLTVGNPSGFKTDEAMSLGLVSVTLADIPSGDAPIHIKEVMIRKPAITYEGGDNGSNLDAIQRNVSRFTGGGGGSSSGGGGAKQKIIIDNLYIKDGQVSVSVLGMDPSTIALPNIHLKDIGKKSGGASPAEVAQKILSSITNGATGVGGKLAKDLVAGAGKAAADAANAAAGAAAGAAGAVGGVGNAVGGATKDIGGAIGGLFGK